MTGQGAAEHGSYRPCAGIMLLNRDGRVFVAQRIDTPEDAWQMPQGGIDRGESPRDVQARLAPWLAEVAARKRPLVAVTHKGVIRAIVAQATGWDMTGTLPAPLAWDCAHLFTLAADGAPAVERLNLSLELS